MIQKVIEVLMKECVNLKVTKIILKKSEERISVYDNTEGWVSRWFNC